MDNNKRIAQNLSHGIIDDGLHETSPQVLGSDEDEAAAKQKASLGGAQVRCR